MLSSFTNKIKNYLFDNTTNDNAVTGQRKRKREPDYSAVASTDCDPDVELVSIKKPRLQDTRQSSDSGLFTGLLSNATVQRMSEWVRSKPGFSDMFSIHRKDKQDKPTGHSSSVRTNDSSRPTPVASDQERWGARPKEFGLASAYVNQGKISRPVVQDSEKHNGRPASKQPLARPALHPAGVTSRSVQTDRRTDASRTKFPRAQSDMSSVASNYSRRFTATESVRLEEKQRYEQLLQQFTTVPLRKETSVPSAENKKIKVSVPSLTSSNDSILGSSFSRDLKEPRRHREDSAVKDRVRVQANSSAQKPIANGQPVPETSVIDLTEMSVIPDTRRSQLSQAVTIDLTEEDDIQRPQYDPQRYKSPSPSVSDYRTSKFAAEDWIKDLTSHFNQKSRERHRLVAEAEIVTKVFDERRKEKEDDLEARIRKEMRIHEREPAIAQEVFVELDDEEEEEIFPELTSEMKQSIRQWFQPQPAGEVLVEKFRLQITRADISTLGGLNWLNDEVINFYMNLLMERGETSSKPKVYAFNTFFYPKVMSGGQSAVKRWTRRVDVLAVDYILIPVHLGMHWCLAVVNFKKKQIQYYDSMGGNNMQCLNAIKTYLCDESLDKKKQEFDLSGWTTQVMKDIPQQMNGSDCGMFACKYAEYITREARITFTQEHMPYFRKRMVYEIVTGKLLQ